MIFWFSVNFKISFEMCSATKQSKYVALTIGEGRIREGQDF